MRGMDSMKSTRTFCHSNIMAKNEQLEKMQEVCVTSYYGIVKRGIIGWHIHRHQKLHLI